MKSNLTFSGGKELERNLKELGNKTSGRLGQNSTRAGARVVAKEAKARVPVRTGNLRDSIVVRGDENLRRAGGSVRQAFVVAKAPHAHLVELGTKHSRKRPFLEPALEKAGQQAIDKMGANLGRGIQREAAKLGRKR